MQDNKITTPAKSSQKKFIFGGILIVAAIILLIITNTKAGAQYFLTVDEIIDRQQEITGKDIRVSGAVLGDTIEYDTENLILRFEVAHVPGDNKEIDAQGGLAMVLHQAVNNPDANRISVVYEGVMPDLLQNEAQAIMTGKIGEDGNFYASELLLKCPTKYEEAIPEQSASS
ncbi:MAG: cytochrome c maturation protein CcmE [Anaerolineaceae bacterium]|jgi:cytochrome c-type biogenesis protein CcmE|nr:cytochrome c maturation protein CcmE [Anaerolineaceae bacterium]